MSLISLLLLPLIIGSKGFPIGSRYWTSAVVLVILLVTLAISRRPRKET